MKEIKLKNVSKNKDGYKIYLGNGTCNAFKSKHDAELFLNTTNKFLTEKLHDIHLTYIDVWKCYQENWFYFENNRNKPKFDLFQVEREILSQLDPIPLLFTLSVQRAGFTNGNFFSFINLQKALNNIENTIRLLSSIYHKHSDTTSVYKMDSYIRRVLYSKAEMDSYGKLSTTKIFKVVPTHISEHKEFIPELSEIAA